MLPLLKFFGSRGRGSEGCLHQSSPQVDFRSQKHVFKCFSLNERAIYNLSENEQRFIRHKNEQNPLS